MPLLALFVTLLAQAPQPAALPSYGTVVLTTDLGVIEIEVDRGGSWVRLATGTTIGHSRIVAVPVTTTSRVRVTIHEARGVPLIASFSLHHTARGNDAVAAESGAHD